MNVYVRSVAPAGKLRARDKRRLQQFTCCDKTKAPPHIKEVQRWFRVKAISYEGQRRQTHSHRLILVFDGDDLAAASSHEHTTLVIAGVEVPALSIMYGAVATKFQGQDLSNGRRASRFLFDVQIADGVSTGNPEFVHTLVHPHNDASVKVAERHGYEVLSEMKDGYCQYVQPIRSD